MSECEHTEHAIRGGVGRVGRWFPDASSAGRWEPCPEPDRACGTCGEREGSVYAKRCCENGDWVEV